MDINKYKNDPVSYVEEVLGINLFEFQKETLRLLHEAKQQNKHLFMSYPYRHGRGAIVQVWNKYNEEILKGENNEGKI